MHGTGIKTLCICWLYVVNICKMHGTHIFKENLGLNFFPIANTFTDT